MGNWRRVLIEGSCDPADVAAVEKYVGGEAQWGPLHYGGLCGLWDWPQETINCVGNLGERDYVAADVAKTLEKIAKVAPSLAVKVHCGADYEEDRCIATVTLAEGKASEGPPERDKIPQISESALEGNFLRALRRRRAVGGQDK